MYLLIFDRLQAERRISFVKGSLAFMTGVHSKVATIMKEMESGTRWGRRTMYVSCRFIASGSISVMRYNNNNNPSILLNLLGPLLALGYHPSSLKWANVIVLAKAGKADYSSPAS